MAEAVIFQQQRWLKQWGPTSFASGYRYSFDPWGFSLLTLVDVLQKGRHTVCFAILCSCSLALTKLLKLLSWFQIWAKHERRKSTSLGTSAVTTRAAQTWVRVVPLVQVGHILLRLVESFFQHVSNSAGCGLEHEDCTEKVLADNARIAVTGFSNRQTKLNIPSNMPL